MTIDIILGVHRPTWLTITPRPTLMVSLTTMPKTKQIAATGPWVLDSGGFTELQLHGKWRTNAKQHVATIKRITNQTPHMQWASPQDWMCEPHMLQKTGLTVAQHQQLTINNFLELRHIAPELPIIPVLQGWHPDDYNRHADDYTRHGIDLPSEPIVGVGSVCRRQATTDATTIFRRLHTDGLKLHAFGLKALGLATSAQYLASSDSMAWSFAERYKTTQCGALNKRTGQPLKGCNNCWHAALEWHTKLVASLTRQPKNGYQLQLDF
jgi:hypothetical protein